MDKIAAKTVVNTIIVVASLMMLSNAGLWGSILAALVLGVIAYVVGDMLILPATSNIVATLADAVLAYVVLWAASAMAGWTMSYMDLLVPVVLLGVAEYIFHIWLMRDGIPGRMSRTDMNGRA
ncbi:DUF2512 family protein [Paenibacillus hunanensis]|uniref:DUF2512 family protein n=1 Tax=Paenibacillus hunanensis TaxID=539262 RepID=UPI002A6B0370|nr:DUF2512 family protein [Paenibacillus hunanensis]WPP41384.1 DUF2512 family protein [Paenibacillus hunanensis]